MRLVLLLHGKLGTWKTAASETKANVTASGRKNRRQALMESRSFARFAHDSLWRHVVLANRADGCHVRVVIHLWNPELAQTLNPLFQPAASTYEAAKPNLNKVQSQHLSLKRALSLLVALPGPPADLILASRPDVLLFDDLLVRHRKLTPAALWLPYHCVPLRLRLPPPLAAAHSRAMTASCSGGLHERGAASGERLQPPQLSRISPESRRHITHADNYNLASRARFETHTTSRAEPCLHLRLCHCYPCYWVVLCMLVAAVYWLSARMANIGVHLIPPIHYHPPIPTRCSMCWTISFSRPPRLP